MELSSEIAKEIRYTDLIRERGNSEVYLRKKHIMVHQLNHYKLEARMEPKRI